MQHRKPVVIGKVAGPFGVKGEVRLRSFAESLETFRRSPVLFIEDLPYSVRGMRMHGDSVLAIVEGINSREDAARLTGKLVSIDAQFLPPKDEDEYYWFELIGMKVITVGGRELGEIEGITRTGANDVLHVQGEFGEVLLPMIEEVVVSVDLESSRMVVDPLDGLIPNA